MKVEDRLQQAGQELRDSTAALRPAPLPARKTPARGWLVFAGVFALVALGLGMLPLLSPAVREQPPLATPGVVTTTLHADATSVVVGTVPVARCSAARMALPPEQEGLPAPVAEARAAISAAAVACDFVALHSLAGDLLTSFGGGDFSSFQAWEDAGEGNLGILIELLGTRFGVQEFEGEPTIYVWPAAFTYDSWDQIPAEDLAQLTEIFGEEEMAIIDGFGSYAGWRIGITEDGDWRFFIAGD